MTPWALSSTIRSMTDPALLSHETGPYLRPLRGEPVFIRVVKPG
jgi:hypothetical protein